MSRLTRLAVYGAAVAFDVAVWWVVVAVVREVAR